VAGADRHGGRADGPEPAPRHGPHRGRGGFGAALRTVVEFRRRTLPPLDDVLGGLRDAIPRLTRSALHRRPRRHGISRLPRDPRRASRRGRFAEAGIGYVHVDHCEIRSAEGELHLFPAIDRVSKFAYVELHPAADSMVGGDFMRGAAAAFPHRIHAALTDNGVAFANCASTRWDTKAAPFGRVCREHGIAHELTRPPYRPWTNGQAERMNRTVEEATVKAFHYEAAEALCTHVLAFVRAYNFAKHLKALRWRAPSQAICDAWPRDPSIFKINPHHLIPGPNT